MKSQFPAASSGKHRCHKKVQFKSIDLANPETPEKAMEDQDGLQVVEQDGIHVDPQPSYNWILAGLNCGNVSHVANPINEDDDIDITDEDIIKGTRFGLPLAMDDGFLYLTSLPDDCDRMDLVFGATRKKISKGAVTVDLKKPLISWVVIGNKIQVVEYENLPHICFTCGRFEHLKETCPNNPQLQKEQTHQPDLRMQPACSENSKMRDVRQIESLKNNDLTAPESDPYDPWMMVEKRRRRPQTAAAKNSDSSKETTKSGSRFEALNENSNKNGKNKQITEDDQRGINLDTTNKITPTQNLSILDSQTMAKSGSDIPNVVGPMQHSQVGENTSMHGVSSCKVLPTSETMQVETLPVGVSINGAEFISNTDPMFENSLGVTREFKNSSLDASKHMVLGFNEATNNKAPQAPKQINPLFGVQLELRNVVLPTWYGTRGLKPKLLSIPDQMSRKLSSECTLPWILAGDFNAILSSNEKRGGRRIGASCTSFRAFMDDQDLINLGFKGNLSRSILNISNELMSWNMNTYGHIIQKQKALMKRLAKIHKEMNITGSYSFIPEEHDIQTKLEEVLDHEELLWQQKSRSTWLMEGDKNTKFFHNRALVRRKTNQILPLSSLPLCTAISDEEIKKANFDMSSLKSPRKDGLHAMFFQSQWQTMGQPVCFWVCGVFDGNPMDPEFNKMLLVLIPKTDSPETSTVLWNGTLSDEFKPSPEIHQGYPLSPYLFVLCMERLAHGINYVVDFELWDPMVLSRGPPVCLTSSLRMTISSWTRLTSLGLFLINLVGFVLPWASNVRMNLIPGRDPLITNTNVDRIANLLATVRNFANNDGLWKTNLLKAVLYDENFHVSSAYQAYQKLLHDKWNPSNNLWSITWGFDGPHRIKQFFWLILHQRLITNAERARKGLTTDSTCRVCHSGEETIIHAFRDWPVGAFSMGTTHTKIKGERADLVGASNDPCCLDVGQRIRKKKTIEERPLGKTSSPKQKWRPPCAGIVKINADGAVNQNSMETASGGVLRDNFGNWMSGYHRDISRCSMFQDQLWGVFDGLNIAWNHGFRNIIVETVQTDNMDESVRIIHVTREANAVAESLAHLGRTRPYGLEILQQVPSGSGMIELAIYRSASYYVALGNLNSEEIEVELNLAVRDYIYNTAEAYYRCTFANGVCSLSILYPQGNSIVLTSPGPEQHSSANDWSVRLSYGPRWITYIVGIGGMTAIMLVALNFLNKFQFTHGDEASVHYGDYEADLEDFLAGSLEATSIGDGENSNNTRRLGAICFDAPRECFFLVCGHCVACFACGTRKIFKILAEAGGTCPVCGRNMRKVRKIFTV
ncbi:RING/U-box superfamily protein, putative isoform 4 [Hibiscus syriacus]|uniref:RING/U-box superfamily protein, putative isoform 4 n=1 Tax=Hibiscus syriacus TaxID=106335 RepID=A0A6A3A0Q7_HIBSY|nr:RING/U-box superfamily protein, putative isoform 4 [Hibiscus syriacus]